MTASGGPIEIVLIVGGRWHDMDFVRLQLLHGLDAHDRVRVRVFEDYACADELAQADALISYTCQVQQAAQDQKALVDFVNGGGRWLALHASNSPVKPPKLAESSKLPERSTFGADGGFGPVAQVLGSRFLFHPPIAPFVVEVVGEDPLVAGLTSFITTDELYICELHPPLRVLLQTRDETQPVLYRKVTGAGEVCYLTLGHCGGKRDRVAWATPQFRQLLNRTLAWAAYGDAWPEELGDGHHPVSPGSLGLIQRPVGFGQQRAHHHGV